MNTMRNPTKGKGVITRPCTMKELADMYGVSRKTLRSWLQPHYTAIGDRMSRYFTVLQLKVIFELLGEPPIEDQ